MISSLQEHLSRSTGSYHMALVRVCTLALLTILGAGVACAQHLKDAEAKSEGLSSWAPDQEGVRTSLSARDQEFSLGRPILFRLEIENLGSRVIRYDPTQVAINSSMSIEGNDGVKVPSIAPNVQTGGDSKALKPGERTVLFETLDIADQYLLTSPGSYKVQFKGLGKGFSDTAIPPSNAITIHVADGPVQPSRMIARKLIDMEQMSGWRTQIVKEGSVVPIGRASAKGASFVLRRGPETKANALRMLLWVTATPSAIEPSGQDAQRGRTAERIGRCPWGDVYLWSGTAPAEELRTVRELIATALRFDER